MEPPWKITITASSIFYRFHLFAEWHVFSSFHDPERQDSETTEMFAQSWSIYLKVAFPWRASARARFKVRSRKQTNAIFTSPSDRNNSKRPFRSSPIPVLASWQTTWCLKAVSWNTCLQPLQIHRPNRKRREMSKIRNQTVDPQRQRGLQMNNF